jgi:predicted AAA+ superfamily ATPase
MESLIPHYIVFWGVFMISRLLKAPTAKSFFLFGPRGTGKTLWVKTTFPGSIYIDLLESATYIQLMAAPNLLEKYISKDFLGWVIIDEVQKIPALLNEVHRLIEGKNIKFILTGSSARQLRKQGTNLLAGRALRYAMHPLTALELGDLFDLQKALSWGLLPALLKEENPKLYLEAYVATYLREEVLQEGLTRNLAAFSRFLEAASFSQGSVLNISEVARECAVDRKTVESYFTILEDLLLCHRIPVFTKRAKRELVAHPKFFYFDVGVYRALRPLGPLDTPEEISGAALETLFLQQLLAINDYLGCDYEIFFWRTKLGLEVDFVVYGPKGLIAFEIKRSKKVSSFDTKGLRAFKEEYPIAKLYLLYGGETQLYDEDVTIMPFGKALIELEAILQ